MRLLPIIARIQSQAVDAGPLVSVGPARGLNAVRDLTVTPAAFVHPVDESGGPNRLDICVSQQVAGRFAVLLAAENIDVAGASEVLEDARDAVFAALIGYQPEAPDGYQITYVRGDVVDIDKSTIWWRDVFMVEKQRRSTA